MTKSKTRTSERIRGYRDQYEKWLRELDPYHTGRFSTNYKQYTAYSNVTGAGANISDPVAPEITERQVNRLFQGDPKFFALAKGQSIPKEITDIISAVPAYYWSCPERVKSTGSMKSKYKVVGREFCIVGQGVTETYYNEESDTPDTDWFPIEDFIFDPTKNLKTSKIIYARKFVDLDYIRDRIEITKDGQVIKGIFKPAAVKRLEDIYSEDANQNDPTFNKITRSGNSAIETKVGPIELISRWEKSKCCRFVKGIDEEEIIVLQEFTSVLDEDPFDRAMDIQIVKQPYAFSMLDFLNGLTKLKDTYLSQMSAYGAKVLNPPLFYDPLKIGAVDKALLANAWKLGRPVPIAPDSADHKPMPSLGNFPFEMLNYIQQRAESVSGIGAYLAGVPNQSNDKTKGTKGGIEMMLEQAAGPLEDRREELEESLIEPMANKWLKMAGYLMGKNEIKYIFITGQPLKWVKVTKGLLTGKIMLNDLIDSELVNELEAQEIVAMMVENGQDPNVDLVFDVDWIVKVETGSTATADKEKEIRNLREWAEFRMQYGIPTDFKKISEEMAKRIGVKEPEQYDVQPQMGGMGNQTPPIMPMMPQASTQQPIMK